MLKDYSFDKSFWTGSALQVWCFFKQWICATDPLKYSCQKVTCFWQCKLGNIQYSFQKVSIVFALENLVWLVSGRLGDLQKTNYQRNSKKGFAGVFRLSFGFNKSSNIKEISRNTLFQTSWDWGSGSAKQKQITKSVEVCWKTPKRKHVLRSLAIGMGRGWPAESFR